MIIKKIAIGNSEESFVECSLSDGFNIISSDDNNKGKTIVIQSLMYALGNDPTFPSSFSYKDYFHYVEFDVNGTLYSICRKNDGFVLRTSTVLMIFDNVSELKRYWTKNIFLLPEIYKNEILRIVDPVLFLQLFFVGQDKKATHNIASSGYYNKSDFINMLFNYCNLESIQLTTEEITIIKSKIDILKGERKSLLQQHKILISSKVPINYLSSISDRVSFDKKMKVLDKINAKITELRKARNIAATRKAKWETTIKELRSLNRTMDCGELRCLDCDSTNISFSTSNKSSYSFDLSTTEMRTEIITSINAKISSYSEEIEKFAISITKEQETLRDLMEDEDVSLESIVSYKREIFNAKDAEMKIKELDAQISELKNSLKSNNTFTSEQKERQGTFLDAVVDLMRKTYENIDPTSNSVVDSLFTKRDEIFSGSEATIFHLSRLFAMQINLVHNFPIVVDSFRAEDLSTKKEKVVIEIFKGLDNQKIFTTTLKAEEFGKYDNLKGITHLDYKGHKPNKILNSSYNTEFKKLMSILSIDI